MAGKNTSPEQRAFKYAAWLHSLAKCAGWKEWILPHLESELKLAEATALDALASGKEVPAEGAAKIRTLRPFFALIEREKTEVTKHIGAQHIESEEIEIPIADLDDEPDPSASS